MPETETERWQVSDLFIDVGSQLVTRGADAIPLPQLSFKFLLALVRAAPNILSTDNLMEQVWSGIYINAETVKQLAKLLRDALGDDPKMPRDFSVRRGVGYQLLCHPVRLDAEGKPSPPLHPAPALRRNWVLIAAALSAAVLGGLSAAEMWPRHHAVAQEGPLA